MRRKSNKPVQERMMGSVMKKILIVEDDTLLNTTLVYNLQEEKLSSASAFSCAQARKLLEKLWDEQENYVDEHTLTTVISRVRGKLEGKYPYIKTVYGMGYLWNGRQERRL